MNIGSAEIILIAALLMAVVIPIAAIVVPVVWMMRSSGKKTASTKKCPFCAETIQLEAILCRYCGKTW